MSVKAPGTNAPINRRTEKALERLNNLTDKYIAEGMSPEEAKNRAQNEMRDNTRNDWRDG